MEHKNVLAIFGHQDDEYAIASRISFEVCRGSRVHCVYLTSGTVRGGDPSVRNEESKRVLKRLGVPEHCIHFMGSEHGIPDGMLLQHMDLCLTLLNERLQDLEIDMILCLAWEGGHPDHDAAHLISLAFSKQRHLLDRTFEFSVYNGYNMPWKAFRVFSPIKTGAPLETRSLTPSEGIRCVLLCLAYKSQWKSWLGLLPISFFRLAVLRKEIIQRVDPNRVLHRPHKGSLHYERWFQTTYEEFSRRAEAFVRKRVLN